MDFEKRLEKAIQRGEQTRDAEVQKKSEKELSEEDLRNLHSKCRLELSDHIENCLKQLADHFPGYRFQTLFGEDGWGAKITRDDIGARTAPRKNLYSRLEMVIRPFSAAHIVELAAKGTIQNKEVLNRTHYQFLTQADLESFSELIDLWILEYAEKYAAIN